MLEFFSADNASDAATLFDGHTVVLPAVSYANLGQLTLDLLINTLLVNGKSLQAEVTKVGHFVSENVPPIAGSAAFSTQPRNALCLNLEVYQIASRKITIIQQRAAAFSGRAQAFAKELGDWATSANVASLCVVSGTDDMLRHDPNMRTRPIRAIYAGETKALENAAFVEQFAALSTSEPVDAWASVRGAGIAPLVHRECAARKLTCVALLMACAEGNNVPDAVAMANHVATYLRLVAPSAANTALPFVFPPSWSQLFGRGPDAALYL